MPDYKTHDPRGWCGDPSRGAALGRPSVHDAPPTYSGKLTLKPVPLSGDYDINGTYFGAGAPLYWYASDDAQIDDVLRAANYTEALAAVRERYPHADIILPTEVDPIDIASMFEAYADTALWSTDGDDGEPLDHYYTAADLSTPTETSMRTDCQTFATEHAATILAAMRKDPDLDWGQVGHDFWLTRNGHGCGFWDGDWPKPEAEALTEAAKRYGAAALYVGDDGKIYTL